MRMDNYRSNRIALLAASFCALGCVSVYRADSQLSSPGKVNLALVRLDQLRDRPVPLDTSFFDESGAKVKLGDYFKSGRPVILNLIFYRCPGVCITELEGMSQLFRNKEMSLDIGKDYDVVTISINSKEPSSLAAEKKREFTSLIDRPNPGAGWHFLVGADAEIRRVADAVGFHYVYDPRTDQFAHPAGIILVTPTGTISKYFYGTTYPAKDVRLALIEAASNKIGSISDQIFLNCIYQYDPKSGRYGLAIMRAVQLGGILTILILGTSIALMSRGKGKIQIHDSLPEKPVISDTSVEQ